MAIKKNRAIQAKDRDERIENMDMDELKRYLCFKNNQDPTKCEGCPGNKTCKAGQRAIALLKEMEKAKMNAENPVMNPKKGKTMAEIQENARRCFIEAAEQPDMIAYVMNTYGNNRNAAREKLKGWARTNPDIAEQTGFWDKFEALSQKAPKNFQKNIHGRTSEAIRKYMEAMTKENPVQFVMDKYGMNRKNASHTYYQWRSRYKDIVQKMNEEDKQVAPVPEEPKEDEVSVADFLKEYAVPDDIPAVSVNCEIHTENNLVVPDILGELKRKYLQLTQEKSRLQERLALIVEAQKALDTTMKLFDSECVTGKIMTGE